MLGADKTFNDRLCWALVLPLSALAYAAGAVAVLAVELLLDADPQHVALRCARAAVAAYAAARLAAKVAPSRKAKVAGGFAAPGAAAALLGDGPGAGAAVAAGLLGGLLAAWVTRRAREEEEEAAPAPSA
ncbi:MAG: hypothetical protein HY554_05085 [Elusimicrobia bacterium]|nr:hypothetical protein [Elusimicrobiota bacterium]